MSKSLETRIEQLEEKKPLPTYADTFEYPHLAPASARQEFEKDIADRRERGQRCFVYGVGQQFETERDAETALLELCL